MRSGRYPLLLESFSNPLGEGQVTACPSGRWASDLLGAVEFHQEAEPLLVPLVPLLVLLPCWSRDLFLGSVLPCPAGVLLFKTIYFS